MHRVLASVTLAIGLATPVLASEYRSASAVSNQPHLDRSVSRVLTPDAEGALARHAMFVEALQILPAPAATSTDAKSKRPQRRGPRLGKSAATSLQSRQDGDSNKAKSAGEPVAALVRALGA